MLPAGLFGGGQRVGQRPLQLPGGVEVVGDLERALRRVTFEGQGRGPVQQGPFLATEPFEERLPQLVVEERAPTGALLDPEDPPAAGLLQARAGFEPVAGQVDGQREVELLAQDRTHRAELQSRRREQFQPADEEQRRPAGRRHVGQRDGVDLPAGSGRLEGVRLDQAAQDGGGHEGAALRQPRHDGQGVGGEWAGHRLAQGADLRRAEGTEGDGGGAGRPQRMVGGHLLGTEGGHD